MRLKSYFSGTVEAAMSLARREMGEDAMLIHSRPASPEARHLGAYEVVFGVYGARGNGEIAEQASAAEAAPRAEAAPKKEREPQPPAPPGEASQQKDWLSQQVANLRQEVERMAKSLAGQSAPVAPIPSLEAPSQTDPGQQNPALASENAPGSSSPGLSSPGLSSRGLSPEDLRCRQLVEQELSPALAREAAAGKRLEDFFEVNATLGREGARQVIVALVGPPGSGKTTTLAKLAARYGLLSRKRAHILSADVFRIGACDQLRTLASLLGIGFGVAESPLDLDRMIEEQYNKDLILIDTPGLSKADMEDARELAQMIGSDPEIDTHLVLPASMKYEDMVRQVDQFRPMRPRKLIFSRVDETSRYGNLLSLASAAALEVSFLGHGQRIPDDLESATKELLVELLTNPLDLGTSLPDQSRGAAA